MHSGIEVDNYPRFESEEDENIFDNKSLVEINRAKSTKVEQNINSQSLDELTNRVYQMVYEQHNHKPSIKQEEVKDDSVQSSDQDITAIINNSQKKQNNYDYKTVLKNEVSQILFQDYPNVNSLLKEHSLLVFSSMSNSQNSKSYLMSFVTGTKLKKVRCLIALNETKQELNEFDKNLKVF